MKRLYFYLFIIVLAGCSKEAELQSKDYPYVVTEDVTEIDATGATFQADVLDYGKTDITDFGFFWSDGTNNYQYSLQGKAKLDSFQVRISTDLNQGVNYSCRAYMKTSTKLILANAVSFVSKGSKKPVIQDFTPKSGYDGTVVHLAGRYFSREIKNNKVFINNVETKVLSSTMDSIAFRIPPNSLSGDLAISVEVGSQKTTASSRFRLYGPEVTSISAFSGFSGDYITIKGHHLTDNGDQVSFSFGSYNAEITDTSDTEIHVIVPVPNDVLRNQYFGLMLTNGMKTVTYPQQFVIETPWMLESSTPFDWSWEYKAFTYDNKGYILELNTKDLYQYSPQTNQWDSIPGSAYTGERNEGSLYLTSNGKLFKVGGYNYLREGVSELWVYSFTDNTWTQKDDLPFSFTNAAVFELNGWFYVVTNQSEVWKCDFENEIYTQMNHFPGQFDFFGLASSFHVGGHAWLVTYGHTWQYNEAEDSWTDRTANNFQQESYSQKDFGFEFNGTGYVVHGGDQLYKYDASHNRWVLVSDYPACMSSNSYKTAFIIGDKAYIPAISGNYSGCTPIMYSYRLNKQ